MFGMRPGWMQQMGEMMGAPQQQMTPGAGMPPHGNAPFDVMQRPQGGQPLGPPPPVQMPAQQQQQQAPMGMGQMGMLQAMLGQQTRRPPGPTAAAPQVVPGAQQATADSGIAQGVNYGATGGNDDFLRRMFPWLFGG